MSKKQIRIIITAMCIGSLLVFSACQGTRKSVATEPVTKPTNNTSGVSSPTTETINSTTLHETLSTTQPNAPTTQTKPVNTSDRYYTEPNDLPILTMPIIPAE